MKYGFIQVAAAVPAVKVADTLYNVEETKRLISDADAQGAEIICFPELGLTAYSCQDLFTQQLLIEESEQALISLMNDTRKLDIISIVAEDLSAELWRVLREALVRLGAGFE